MATILQNQMTLRAILPEDRELFETWDDERDLIIFTTALRPYLTDDWDGPWKVVDKHGRVLTISVRAADCGADCRCAGEYVVTRLNEKENSNG